MQPSLVAHGLSLYDECVVAERVIADSNPLVYTSRPPRCSYYLGSVSNTTILPTKTIAALYAMVLPIPAGVTGERSQLPLCSLDLEDAWVLVRCSDWSRLDLRSV